MTYFSKCLNYGGNTGKAFDDRSKVRRVVKGPLVSCRSNKYQNCLKMSENMLVILIIQNSRFDYDYVLNSNSRLIRILGKFFNGSK